MLYIFYDEETGNEVGIYAESHPEAMDIAYEAMSAPAFVRAEEVK